MKTDNYLALCLEQASKSPLHYRHGAIIVRGGKVIGHGFNDYRHGFDGGALKTGKTSKVAKHPSKTETSIDSTVPFVPFENMNGGGHHANTPLSMHSEMMAINSALAQSTTLSSKAMSSIKPYCKLSGDSKPHSRLRNERLKAFKSGVLKPLHLNLVNLDNVFHKTKERDAAREDMEDGMEKHRKKNGGYGKKGKAKQYQYHHHGHSGRQRRQVHTQHVSETDEDHATINSILFKQSNEAYATKRDTSSPRDIDESHNRRESRDRTIDKQSTSLLVPSRLARTRTATVNDRKKHPRLNGADLYVARFGSAARQKDNQSSKKHPSPHIAVMPSSISASCMPKASTLTASLYDELLNPHPKFHDTGVPASAEVLDPTSIHASRPCYRCVLYMYNVGIKRVFWTAADGSWQCAKLRSLVDALDRDGSDGDGCGMFVTKHEVLMMRRLMGEK